MINGMNSSLPAEQSSSTPEHLKVASPPASWHERFRMFAGMIAHAVGSPWAFAVAVTAVIVWAAAGPRFQYSNTWQLVINTGTTIVTFLMVFLIQNTQNRDARAMHLKLDELIHGVKGARNMMVDLEHCTDEEIAAFEKEFADLRKRHGVEPGSGARRRQGQARAQADREVPGRAK
jgi:low affinity Fe/Cu permease